MKAQDILFSLGKSLTTRKIHDGKVIVHYENCEVKKGIFLEGTFGVGENFEQACEDYLEKLHGQTLVFNAMTKSREEIRVL